MIEVSDLTFSYKSQSAETRVFDGFNWRTQNSESWAVIGPSGCGKTTLLYLLAGLHRPEIGRITIGGQEILRPRPETGLVLQDHGLLPWATIRDNVALGLRIRRFYGPDGKHAPSDYSISDGAARVALWLERLGIAAQADSFPGQVSGGQRQRTAIARTLVLGPDTLLMDEPFSSLDAPTREDLQDVVIQLQRDTELSVVLVTHSIEEAVFLGQKILLLGQPPNTEPHIIANPGATTDGYRTSEEFLRRCNQIRDMLGLVA